MLTSTCQPHKINLFYTSPGEAHCIQIGRKHQEQRSWMPISLKLQEIACCRHQKSTQEVEKPPYAKFQNCCRCCRMLQDVARWNISRKWSLRTVRLPPLNLASSITPERGKSHFFGILCNVADAPVLAIAAETRYSGSECLPYLHSCCLLTSAAEFVYRSQSILSAQAHQPAGDKICETGAGRRAQASRRRWAPSPQLQEDGIHLTATASFHVTLL